MESTNRYLTGMILATAAVMFGGFTFLRGAVKTYGPLDPDISYSMPRPKNKSALYTWLFGLEGREIKYNEVNPFKDKKDAATIAGAKASVRKDQKGAPKIDPKKAVKDARANTPIAAPKAPEVTVNVVNANPENSVRGTADVNGGMTPGAVSAPLGNAAAAPAGGDNSPQELDGMSPAQWRALVVAQPSKENVKKLIEAFNKKEVDANTLYLIMNDLLQSSNADSQNAGLLLAQEVPSLKSYSAVAVNYDKLNTANKAKADTYFATYMQVSRLPVLAMALKSTDPVVVQHAVQTMVTGLQKVKPGTGTPDNRPSRGVVSTARPNVYAQFIPILQSLIQGSDSSVAGLAQSALTQIQGLSNA